MRVQESLWGWTVVVLAAVTLAGCAAERRAAPSLEAVPSDYTKSVIAHDRHLSGGVAVLSAPTGDIVFFADGAAIDEVDGDTGHVRRRHALPLPNVDGLGRDGNRLVLISSHSNHVAVWDPSTEEVVEEHNGFGLPVMALRFDGALMVVEQQRGSIARQAPDATSADTFVTGMRAPAGLTATTGALWVDDWASGTILQVVADRLALAEPIEVANGLSQPEGLAVVPGGNTLVVAETGNDRLLRVNSQARTIQVIDDRVGFDISAGSGMNPTNRFAGVAVGACGTIYVTADRSGEVLRYAPKGPLTCTYGE